MIDKLEKLANQLSALDVAAANYVYKLAGRHDKVIVKLPTKLQPAYKYIMYLKLCRNLDDETFHKMKRRYIDTSQKLQNECFDELNKIVLEDALSKKIPSSTIRREFQEKLEQFERDLWPQYFELSLGKRSG